MCDRLETIYNESKLVICPKHKTQANIHLHDFCQSV